MLRAIALACVFPALFILFCTLSLGCAPGALCHLVLAACAGFMIGVLTLVLFLMILIRDDMEPKKDHDDIIAASQMYISATVSMVFNEFVSMIGILYPQLECPAAIAIGAMTLVCAINYRRNY